MQLLSYACKYTYSPERGGDSASSHYIRETTSCPCMWAYARFVSIFFTDSFTHSDSRSSSSVEAWAATHIRPYHTRWVITLSPQISQQCQLTSAPRRRCRSKFALYLYWKRSKFNHVFFFILYLHVTLDSPREWWRRLKQKSSSSRSPITSAKSQNCKIRWAQLGSLIEKFHLIHWLSMILSCCDINNTIVAFLHYFIGALSRNTSRQAQRSSQNQGRFNQHLRQRQ